MNFPTETRTHGPKKSGPGYHPLSLAAAACHVSCVLSFYMRVMNMFPRSAETLRFVAQCNGGFKWLHL